MNKTLARVEAAWMKIHSVYWPLKDSSYLWWVSFYQRVALASPDQVSLEHLSEIHCLFNSGMQTN